jgi:hypothetical protein
MEAEIKALREVNERYALAIQSMTKTMQRANQDLLKAYQDLPGICPAISDIGMMLEAGMLNAANIIEGKNA